MSRVNTLLTELQEQHQALMCCDSWIEAAKIRGVMHNLALKLDHHQLESGLMLLGLDQATTWFKSSSTELGSFLQLHSLFDGIPGVNDFRHMVVSDPDRFINMTIHRMDQSET